MTTRENRTANPAAAPTRAGNPRERALERNAVPDGWDELPARYRDLAFTVGGRSARPPRRRTGPSRKTLAVEAALALAAILLFGACGQAISDMTSQSGLFSPASGKGSALASAATTETSTPRSEWRKGEVPYLYQTDPQWRDVAYAGGTIADSGCGPTCLAMAYVGLTGKTDQTPVTLAAASERDGHVDGGMTSWTFMTEGASSLGLRSRELPADAGIITSALRDGNPVIASLAPGEFTDVGHFIVLCGVARDGSIEIRDPNSSARSHETWQLDRLISQALNFWAFC